jgi:hypothetical protein
MTHFEEATFVFSVFLLLVRGLVCVLFGPCGAGSFEEGGKGFGGGKGGLEVY